MTSTAIPGILYHYTSRSALLGIVENRNIWATSILHLNDEQEFRHAIEVARDEAKRLKESASASNPIFLEAIVERLSDDPFKFLEHFYIFVASFTEREDLLSQWRSYCPKGGVSIGFDFTRLKTLANNDGFRLKKCEYRLDEQKKIVEVLINDAIKENATIDYFLQRLFMCAPTFKHETFSEEEEWRLISSTTQPKVALDPRINYRDGGTTLIPYYEFQLAANSETLRIPSIVVSPGPNQELSRISIEKFLRQKRVEYSEVKPSAIPYRRL